MTVVEVLAESGRFLLFSAIYNRLPSKTARETETLYKDPRQDSLVN